MANRPCDLVLAAAALVPALPVCLLAAAGIWLDRRPAGALQEPPRRSRRTRVHDVQVPHDAQRGSLEHGASERGPATAGAVITGHTDTRVFAFGAWLRASKIDELPQLVNVLLGDMAIVGPRPEDPAIVDAWYGPLARETLAVRPGLASPGSIYNFTHAEPELDSRALPGEDVAATYARLLLPRKLALDLVYVREASVAADLRIMLRAARAIARATARPPHVSRSARAHARASDRRRAPHPSPQTGRLVMTVLARAASSLVLIPGWLASRLEATALRWRRPIVVLLHLSLITASNYAAFWLRFDGDIPATGSERCSSRRCRRC